MSYNSKGSSPVGAIVGILAAILLLVGAGYGLAQLGGGSAEGRGGDSNFDNIVLDGDLTVGDDATITDDLTVGGDTQTIGTSGTVSFWTVGGMDFAAVTESFTSTSSVPLVIDNPFSATTSIDRIMCDITANGLGGTQIFDISTTTASGGYGSSTPALIYGATVTSKGTYVWQAKSTSSPTVMANFNLYSREDIGAVSPYILKPGEDITLRVATSSPGSDTSGFSGSCSLLVSKP